MPQEPNNTMTAGQIAKQKNKEKAERRYRAMMDARLEAEGLLAYQNRGLTAGQLNQKIANAGIPMQRIEPQAPTLNYTVRDGDNINTIATQYGLQPEDILNANPEVNTMQTGMVVNVPNVKYNPPKQNMPPGGFNTPADVLFQSMGLPTVGQQLDVLPPTIWGNPTGTVWNNAWRSLVRFPAIGIPIEFGARTINKLSGNKFENWWR